MIQAFITQIYHEKLTSDKGLKPLMKSLALDAENLLASDEAGHKWSAKNYIEGYTSYGSVDKLHYILPAFKKLEKLIDTHVASYIKSLDFDISAKQIGMTHCWVNIMPEGALHTSHIHPLSVISGTFYLQTPPKSSAIKFEDPRLGFFMNTPTVKANAQTKNKRFISVNPNEGDVVLFESWIRHEVTRNESSDPRISISFNYGWKENC